MTEFQIFKNVGLPPAKRGPGFGPRESKYPFEQLEIGECLVVPGMDSKSFGSTARAAEKKLGIALTVRTGPIADDEGNEIVPAGGVGVWRVAEKAPRNYTPRTPEQIAASVAKAKATREANKLKKAA